ncbi:MAG: helix-turn-helix transcriptional regulator [Hyphomicrobiales bacterium]|nr:helix-turn-helix transcriptional regulator [Hyphomicrobiales bacterium]
MSNVVQFLQTVDTERLISPIPKRPRTSAGKFPITKRQISSDFLDVAKTHGFNSYAVLDISERREEYVFPWISFHGLAEELAQHFAAIEDMTNCSVFLMLSETNVPFPFTTGLDCRTNEVPDPSLLDNQMDALLRAFGIMGGYCVPVCAPDSRRSVVMYFGPREETYNRYPSLVLDTIESFDAIWQEQVNKKLENRFGLSAREIKCLGFLARGKNVSEIGKEFSLSEHTIAAYLNSCVAKTSANSVQEALFITNSDRLI